MGSEATPMDWPLRDRGVTVIDFVVVSQAKSVTREEAFARSLLDLRDWMRVEARAAGSELESAEYVCTSLDPNARKGLRGVGFEARRDRPPIHLSHTYLRGSGTLDVLDRIVRGTKGTYGGAHGRVLAAYRAARSAVLNLFAFDRDPLTDDRTRTAAYRIFDKPPHAAIHYEDLDLMVGKLLELTRGRAGSSGSAAWRRKLGLGSPPEYWLEWRGTDPFDIPVLDAGFTAWDAPRAVKARVREGWLLLANRIG